MKNFIHILIIGLIALLFAPVQSDAQIGPGRFYTYDTDTLTNADTLAQTFFKSMEEEYTYVWQVTATNISDTTNVTGYLQERLTDAHSWVNVDTISFATTGSTFITGNTKGQYQRLYLLSANTGATQIKSTAWYRRRKF